MCHYAAAVFCWLAGTLRRSRGTARQINCKGAVPVRPMSGSTFLPRQHYCECPVGQRAQSRDKPAAASLSARSVLTWSLRIRLPPRVPPPVEAPAMALPIPLPPVTSATFQPCRSPLSAIFNQRTTHILAASGETDHRQSSGSAMPKRHGFAKRPHCQDQIRAAQTHYEAWAC